MVENLTKALKSGMAMSMLYALLALTGSAIAEQDPTRPAYGAGSQSTASIMKSGAHVKGLRSVVISSQRCAAIIDGKFVMLGELFGKDRLVEILEDRVVLQGASGQKIMHLYPAVELKVKKNPDRKAEQPECRMDAGQLRVQGIDGVKEKK